MSAFSAQKAGASRNHGQTANRAPTRDRKTTMRQRLDARSQNNIALPWEILCGLQRFMTCLVTVPRRVPNASRLRIWVAVCQGIRRCPGGEDESSSRWRADAQACRRSGWTRDGGRILGRERRLRNPKEPATSIPTVAFQDNLRRCVVPLVQSRRILHILQAARASARYDHRILVERRVPRTSVARLGEDAGSRSNRCPPQFCDDRAFGLHNASRVGCQMPRVAAAPNATIQVAWTLILTTYLRPPSHPG